MASVGGVQSSGGNLLAGLLADPGQNIAVQATLLKKATEADKNLVNTLLPPSGAGLVDIRA